MAHRNDCLRLLGVAGAILLALGCNRQPTTTSSPEVPAPGVASFDPRIVELGDVPLYSNKEFKAQFRNRSTNPIEIAGFQANCGCAILSASKKSVEPGDEIEVTGTFRAGSKGAFRKQLLARAKDGAVFDFEIVGEVKAELAFDSDGITLAPDFLDGKGASGEIEISNRSANTIHLQAPVGLPTDIQARLERAELQPGKSTKLLFTVAPVFVKNTDFKVDVATTHRLEGTLSIPVRVRPTQALTIVPGEVRLGVASKNDLLKRGKLSLTLLGQALDRVTVDSVDCPCYLKLQSRSSKAPRRVELDFEFVDSFAGVDLVGEITVKLIERKPDGASRTIPLRVPVSGLLQES